MKIACICCTFNRPGMLAESIECFRRQSYPAARRELVVLDDAGQYDPGACDRLPGVKLVTTRHRFRTLGEKRNATAALISPDVEALAIWDDDDIYLPWHLERAAELLASDEAWSRPAEVWIDHPRGLRRRPAKGLFHAAWVLTREVFLQAGGYPAMQSGQDQALGKRLRRAGILHKPPAGPPSFVYRWGTVKTKHLSAMGKSGYQRRGRETIARHAGALQPAWSQDWAQKARQAMG